MKPVPDKASETVSKSDVPHLFSPEAKPFEPPPHRPREPNPVERRPMTEQSLTIHHVTPHFYPEVGGVEDSLRHFGACLVPGGHRVIVHTPSLAASGESLVRRCGSCPRPCLTTRMARETRLGGGIESEDRSSSTWADCMRKRAWTIYSRHSHDCPPMHASSSRDPMADASRPYAIEPAISASLQG